jgi:hypothetical protein
MTDYKEYRNNTPFEWIVFAIALVLVVVGVFYIEDNSVNYLISALLYFVTAIGMISKTSRARGLVSQNVIRIWLLAIALVFLAAALAIYYQSRHFNMLWMVGIIVFGLVGRKKKI